MKPNRRWRPLPFLVLLGASCVCGCTSPNGCLKGNALASTPTPHDEVGVACQNLPRCQRDRVHVFLVNGLDPRYLGRMDVVADYVHRLGFENTHLAAMYHCGSFKEKIRTIAGEDPDARFVLMGFGLGANLVKDMANDLGAEGIDVDLLVYLASDTVEDTPEFRPENVRRIVNVTGQGYLWNCCGMADDPAKIDGADNLHLAEAGHYEVPSNLKTLALLSCRLGEVAAAAGPPPAPVPSTPVPPTLPPPRKVPPDTEHLSRK